MSRASVAEQFRVAFANLAQLDPADIDGVVLAVIGHLRQLRPEQFGCLSLLPKPEERIADPRGPSNTNGDAPNVGRSMDLFRGPVKP